MYSLSPYCAGCFALISFRSHAVAKCVQSEYILDKTLEQDAEYISRPGILVLEVVFW